MQNYTCRDKVLKKSKNTFFTAPQNHFTWKLFQKLCYTTCVHSEFTEVSKDIPKNQAVWWFLKKTIALPILGFTSNTVHGFVLVHPSSNACSKKSLQIRPAENSAVPHAYFLCLPWSILINIDRIWWYQTIDRALSILRLPRK